MFVIGSILKRGRNVSLNNSNKENIYAENTSKSVTPSQKRVKIITPLEEIEMNNLTTVGSRMNPIYRNPKKLFVDGEDDEDQSNNVIKTLVGSDFCDVEAHKNSDSEDEIVLEVSLTDYLFFFNNIDRSLSFLFPFFSQTAKNQVKKKSDHNIKIRRRNKKDYDNWLLVRYQPKILSDALRSLSPVQKKWVKSTGFASLLSFKMQQYPQAMCYYLAYCFDVSSTSLLFGNDTIPITAEDVNEVLGLPIGAENVQIIRSSHIEDRWRSQFKDLIKDGWKVTANMVCNAIKNSNQADRLFKLNFMVLMYNILIEGPTNPYVKQNIIGFAGNID